jgi:hypothetical protein
MLIDYRIDGQTFHRQDSSPPSPQEYAVDHLEHKYFYSGFKDHDCKLQIARTLFLAEVAFRTGIFQTYLD